MKGVKIGKTFSSIRRLRKGRMEKVDQMTSIQESFHVVACRIRLDQ